MPFPRIPTRLHTFRIVMTEAESALLDLYARELGTDRESAAGLAMTRTLMNVRLVQQVAEGSAERKIMTALKFRCPQCGADTGLIEREVGCRVETRISQVEGGELVRGKTITTEPGEVVAYACDLCGAVVMDAAHELINVCIMSRIPKAVKVTTWDRRASNPQQDRADASLVSISATTTGRSSNPRKRSSRGSVCTE